MLNIKGQTGADYFLIICEKCGKETENEYLGYDPAVPHFRAKCEKCGTSGAWKLQAGAWKGLPATPHES